ncbi:MAG: acyl-CoA dehydrogenase [Bdellovibrionales bacterium]|nr:acyl-CoA dehydrogenase [Bdellovibrionales bacterium]
MQTLLIIVAIILVTLFIPPIRRHIYSFLIMKTLQALKFVPKISQTEKVAIDAGSAWVEKQFFEGQPKMKILLKQPLPKLTADEKAFLDTKVEPLCAMIDDWEIWKNRTIGEATWNYIRSEKFLGMIIPKKYGGLEFSAYAHSEVVKRVASRSLTAAIYVMVPNSLGPAELLIHYGTEAQKDYYLPRLASGVEVPCFALTEPTAGSDASSIESYGVLFKKNVDGKDELWIRLNWRKRYITLAKISTVLGLAFQLKDPEGLAGDGKDIGITCALIPSNAKGVILEHRHDPMSIPFYNCPTHGENVEIPTSAIIGGMKQAGNGWKMLMQSLAAGRGISFPALTTGESQLQMKIVAAHATARHQFGVPLAKFEGIQKPLSEVIAYTYLLDTLRTYTLSAIDQGIKPSIVTAMAKLTSTEYARKIVNNAMDVLGGAGISMGPKNRVAPYYIAAPVGITVEGANILTRTLVIFGQGAFRAHPHALSMIDALDKKDLAAFDRAIWAQVLHTAKNTVLAPLMSLTRGWIAHPFIGGREARYIRRLTWSSTSFAWLVDFAMMSLGGKLKLKESVTGRLADVMCNLYLASAILNRVRAEKPSEAEWQIARYALDHVFYETELAFEGLYQNMHLPLLTWSRLNPFSKAVSDKSMKQVSELVFDQQDLLNRLTQSVYRPRHPGDHLNQLEKAAKMYVEVAKLHKVQKSGIELTAANQATLREWERLYDSVIQVDEFTEEEYTRKSKLVAGLEQNTQHLKSV